MRNHKITERDINAFIEEKIIDNAERYLDYEWRMTELGGEDVLRIYWGIDEDEGAIKVALVPIKHGHGAHEASYQWAKRLQKNILGFYNVKRNRGEYSGVVGYVF